MFKVLSSVLSLPLKTQNVLLPANELLYQQARTTYILKRKNPPLLHKNGKTRKTLRSRHYVYELVKDTTRERPANIEVILTSLVEGLGNVGDKVSVKPHYGYNNLLLPGLAVYATPENQDRYKDIGENTDVIKYSTPTAAYTVQTLSRMTLSVTMNKDVHWTLKPWHVKASFRKCGYVVPEDAIELPKTPITGPDMSLENKEFAVVVTINKKEKVTVRCRLHHWSTDVVQKLPYVHEFWEIPAEPIIPEQKLVLEALPKKPPVKNKVPMRESV